MDKSPILGERYDVPDGLCIPTPPVFAYYSHICVDRLQKGVEALFIDTIGLSEWVVQVVMAFVAVAYDGVKYYARCRDSRLYHSVANDPNRGRLFRLPGDVMSLARTMGLDKMMEGCETTAVQVEELFAHVEMIDWEAHGCDFVWFNWDENRVVHMPPQASFPVGGYSVWEREFASCTHIASKTPWGRSEGQPQQEISGWAQAVTGPQGQSSTAYPSGVASASGPNPSISQVVEEEVVISPVVPSQSKRS